MKKTAIALALSLGALGTTGAAQAGSTSGEFCMFDSTGAAVSDFSWGTVCDQQVTGGIDTVAGTWSVSSPQAFFGVNWVAHTGTLLGEGTHTIATVEGGTYTGIVVGAGQVGGHILFNWGAVSDIDVVNVWDVSTNLAGDTIYTSTDVTAGMINGVAQPDGILGLAMIDGAFAGFSANFNMVEPIPVPAAVWLFGSGLLGLVGVARRKKAA